MRRSPGSFVRETLNRLSLLETGGVGFLIGLLMGFLLFLVGDRFGRGWAITGFLITAITVYLAVRILNRPSFRWNYENLRKGVLAETRVGQLIEYAITAEDCAVAHGVTRPAKVGDIDHIVATPVGIWVIETKYQRVPGKVFNDVLSRIAANTRAVRELAPIGTQVRGCLVLAKADQKKPLEYSYGKEKITAYTPALLVRKLKSEAQQKRVIDERVTKYVWELGRSPVSLKTKLPKPKIRFSDF